MNLATLDRKIGDEQSRRVARDDRAAFARLVGVEPDPWQEAVLNSNAARLLLNITRQGGKSTTCSLVALHTALYKEHQTILIISPSERQSQEVIRKVVFYLTRLCIKPRMVGDSKTTIEFANGSRIIGLPATENTVRSFTADLIIEDEAGDVDDELHGAILPMLIVSRGRLILAGTPKGRRGHFFEYWERGTRWEHHRVPWNECPRIPEAEIADQKLILRERFAQEYECAFLSGGSGLVYGNFDAVRNCIDALPLCTLPGQKWAHMLGMDFGFTAATGLCVIATRAYDPCVYVVESSKHRAPTSVGLGTTVTGLEERAAKDLERQMRFAATIGARVAGLEQQYRFTRVIGDTGGLGKGFSEELRRRFRIPIEPAEKQNKRGYQDLMNGDLLLGRILLVRDGNREYIDELTTLPWNDTRSAEAPGFENHICDAGLYIWRAATTYLQKAPDATPAETPAQVHHREAEDFWKREEDKRQRALHERDGGFDWIFK